MNQVFHGVWRRLVGFFLAGVFAILPLVITVAIIIWVTELLQGFVGPSTVIGRGLRTVGGSMMTQITESDTAAYLFGISLVLSAILLLGVFVQMGGRKLLRGLVDQVIPRVPIVGTVYNTSSQLIEMLERNEETDLKGMSVVYVVLGQDGGGGLLALLPTPEAYHFDGRDYQIVYLPTSPIPMTGGLLFVPRENVHSVDMTVEGLMSVYLSMGVTGPKYLKGDGDAS